MSKHNRFIDEPFEPSVDQKQSKNPALDAAALELAEQLQKAHPYVFSVGHDEINTIHVYEHVRGFAKHRL